MKHRNNDRRALCLSSHHLSSENVMFKVERRGRNPHCSIGSNPLASRESLSFVTTILSQTLHACATEVISRYIPHFLLFIYICRSLFIALCHLRGTISSVKHKWRAWILNFISRHSIAQVLRFKSTTKWNKTDLHSYDHKNCHFVGQSSYFWKSWKRSLAYPRSRHVRCLIQPLWSCLTK